VWLQAVKRTGGRRLASAATGCDMSPMPTHIVAPARVAAAGNPPKLIDEYVGRVNSGTAALSVAHMRSPAGWSEPRQRPEFTEYTVVLKGMVRIEHDGGVIEVQAGQAAVAHPGEAVRYSTPESAEYVAVCVPAFSPQTVHRDD
jgi:quercetin dioxygenase-like cupin family protein